MSAESSLVWLAESLDALPGLLRSAFEHPWVSSYQVGFGPPLIRSSKRLEERLGGEQAALDKLTAYLEVCVLDADERERLSVLHRRMLVRRHGPVEAEDVNRASLDVLDLNLRLHVPDTAPEAVRAEMKAAGVDPKWVKEDLPPDVQSARFVVHLHDPRNERILHHDRILGRVDVDRTLALELRVPVDLLPLWRIWAEQVARITDTSFVPLGEPPAHARVIRNGSRR